MQLKVEVASVDLRILFVIRCSNTLFDLSILLVSSLVSAGGMTLYLKAGPDGKSVGDCPFAHFVRLTLEEKGLEYQLKPTTPENKPEWLLDHYEGKLPALRHYKECYVESDTICDYLDFFFVEPPLQVIKSKPAEIAFDGFFPAVAAYLKHTPDGDDEDVELQHNLEEKLSTLETHLQEHQPFLVDEQLTLLDLSLAPKLYHMSVGMKAFKNNAIDVSTTYPRVKEYMDTIFARDSFQKTVYPEETVVWGWSNAREGAAAKV